MPHTRESSRDSPPAGSSYGLILEHVLSYPGSYELPLRTMYTLNCISRAQPLPQNTDRPCTPFQTSNQPSPTSLFFSECPAVQTATAQFTSSLLNRIGRLPSQPCSLPPVFINSFLRRCFYMDLALVDFPQALTALDYLKDLETRRRRELASALQRLGVAKDPLVREAENFSKSTHPVIVKWVETMEKNDNKIEALYTQLYVALRRWILINELSLTPFSKHNCLAMLNTLYPPTSTSRPTSKLTSEVLKRQRDTFFKYVQSVERRGIDVLKPLMRQNTNPGDENGWPRVRNILDNYLRVATSLIDECVQISDLEEFVKSNDGEQGWNKRQGGKADSGVSFASNDGRLMNGLDDRKRLGDAEIVKDAPPLKKHYSTLERIAFELRKLRAKTRSQVSLRSVDKEKSVEKEGKIGEGKENIIPPREINVNEMDLSAVNGNAMNASAINGNASNENTTNNNAGNGNGGASNATVTNNNAMTDSTVNEESSRVEPTQPKSPSKAIRRLKSLSDLKSLSRSPPASPRGGGVSTLLSYGNEARKDGKSLAERIVVVQGASHSFG